MTEPTDPYGQPANQPLPTPTDPYAPQSSPPSGSAPYDPVPPGYAPQPGYPPQPGYAPPPGYAGQPGYAPQPAYTAQPGYPPVPYAYPAYDPATGQPYSDKSRVVAGVLGIALGAFGAGRFYTGHTGIAVAQIAVTWLTCGIGHIWPLIDGIIMLAQGGTDAEGRVLRP